MRKHNGSDIHRPRLGCSCWDCRADRAKFRAERDRLKVLLDRRLWASGPILKGVPGERELVRAIKRLTKAVKRYGGFNDPPAPAWAVPKEAEKLAKQIAVPADEKGRNRLEVVYGMPKGSIFDGAGLGDETATYVAAHNEDLRLHEAFPKETAITVRG